MHVLAQYSKIGTLALLLGGAFSVASIEAATPAEVDNLVLQWTQIERQKSQISNSWVVRKQVLEQQLQLLEDEELALKALLENSGEQQNTVESKRTDLLKSQESMEASQALMEQGLARALITIRNLHIQLPPPLKESWDQTIGRLEIEGATGSERLEEALELLSQLQEFDSRVAVYQVRMTFDNNQEVQVDQIYLGISQGWYVSAKGDYFGYGHATPEGWQWQHKDSLTGNLTAQILQDFVANARQETRPELLHIPIDITRRKNLVGMNGAGG